MDDHDSRARFNRLVARGSEYRHELLVALYELWQRLEDADVGVVPAAARPLHAAMRAFLVALAQSEELGTYMGKEKTDAYGIVVDKEVGADLRRGFKWARDTPHRRIFVPLTREEVVQVGVAVDRWRRAGRPVTAEALPTLCGVTIYARVLDAVHDHSDSPQDRDELLSIMADALEAQSVERVLVLAESFPDHLKRE